MRRFVASLSAIVATATVLALLAATAPSAIASSPTWIYYKDKFAERDYDGNDAAGQFSSDWVEEGEANGPLMGYASVTDHDYCYTYCLQIGAGVLAVGNVGIERSLNLEGALEVKVTFIYATDLFGGSIDEEVALQISSDGGYNFTTLKTYPLDDDEDMQRQDYITVSEFAAPQTVIRFISIGGAPQNVLLIDDFLVKAKFEGEVPPATTSTTTTSTSTTTSTTSTTTLPPTTTTTTTTTLPPVDTTTTTKPPDRTTTTSTSTTVPSSTTTTTTPAAGGIGAPPPGSDESFLTKDALVVTDVAHSEVPGVRPTAGGSEPVSLAVSFRTTAEAFTGGALPSTILGVLIAVLAVIGLSRGLKPDTQ